jgi:hypothetical protein
MSNLSDLKAAGGSGKSIKLVASGALANGNKVILQSDGTVKVVGIGSTVLSQDVGSEIVFNSGQTTHISAIFDSNSNKIVIAYRDGGNSDYGTAVVGTVSGMSISFGSEVIFNTGNSYDISATFDSNSNKMVIVYKDVGNSNYGTAIVGTVSGTSISFGSEVVFNSFGSYDMTAIFDSNSNKVVIAYTHDGSGHYGTAIVGTVSGTSISFGSKVVYNSGSTARNPIAFDSNSNKVVIAYRDGGNSGYGTAIVGTVSGTSISFGSEVVFNTGNTGSVYKSIYLTFDSNSNKIVIAYRDSGNSSYGTAIVGTVSGTSISFGSEVVFNSATVSYVSSDFASNVNKVVIAYVDGGGSGYTNGKAIVGTVSGTSISFASAYTLNLGGSYTTQWLAVVFDPNVNKMLITYMDEPNSSNGTGVVWQTAGTSLSTNLTATNFLGISEGAAADTATATVMLRGGITTTQSGLTIGSTYYVQGDGTLSTTAGSPSVVAGQAISTTTLLIEGES